jgi:hypothetical protein
MDERASTLVVVGASAGGVGVEALVDASSSPAGRKRTECARRSPTSPAAISAAVRRLTEEVPMSENGGHDMSLETEYASLDVEMLDRDEPPDDSSAYSCPPCGGVPGEAREQADGIRRLLATANAWDG